MRSLSKNYVLGLDFGTLSARAILVKLDTGATVSEAVADYPHGVMDERLPSGKVLPSQFALEDPADYLFVLGKVIREALAKAGASPEDVGGVCLDVTACSILPLDEEGKPLSFLPEFADEPHAYVKLWKHHGAQAEADEINALAAARKEPFLARYGGTMSCEFALPKILEIARKSPPVYRKTARFAEIADWLSFVLTGEETHSAVFAGYKWCYDPALGFPADDFFRSLDEKLGGIVGTKISEKIRGVGEIAGRVSAEGAKLTGLAVGTPVAMPMIDGHAGVPALRATEEGTVMMIVGTSSCQMVSARATRDVPGICGQVKDGVIPGLTTYEAGQAAVGDAFAWFVDHCVPADYAKEAENRGVTLHALLREKAEKYRPGESGLVALDWWNGCRSVLDDADLSGLIVGLSLTTKPEEIYRAMLESAAFGTRRILDQFRKSGLPVSSFRVSGGIARKDPLLMQIYADVTGLPVHVCETKQAGALGSAIYAAVAAGAYPDVSAASAALGSRELLTYLPNEEHRAVYDRLYAVYKRLYDSFGDGEVMHELRKVARSGQ